MELVPVIVDTIVEYSDGLKKKEKSKVLSRIFSL
jgi:hypothetical protein